MRFCYPLLLKMYLDYDHEICDIFCGDQDSRECATGGAKASLAALFSPIPSFTPANV